MPPIKFDAEQKSANININKTIEIEKQDDSNVAQEPDKKRKGLCYLSFHKKRTDKKNKSTNKLT